MAKSTVKAATKNTNAAKPAVKPVDKASGKVAVKQHAAPTVAHRFVQTPPAGMLRSYFVAWILHQIGALKADTPFKLWPSFNATWHISKGTLQRQGVGHSLTVAGAEYFNSDKQSADADLVKAFQHAIATGQKPDAYKFTMLPMTLK